MKTTFLAGHGFWQTNRYPIGGEFHRPNENMAVTLTGRKIDFGTYNGFVEFTGNYGGKPMSGYARPSAFECNNIPVATLNSPEFL